MTTLILASPFDKGKGFTTQIVKCMSHRISNMNGGSSRLQILESNKLILYVRTVKKDTRLINLQFADKEKERKWGTATLCKSVAPRTYIAYEIIPTRYLIPLHWTLEQKIYSNIPTYIGILGQLLITFKYNFLHLITYMAWYEFCNKKKTYTN